MLLFSAGCTGVSDEDYVQSIQAHRAEIHQFMRTSDQSPFSEIAFDSLAYFPVNPAYRVTATYQPIGNRKVRNLATSDGKEEAYEEYGHVFFDLGGAHHQLLVLKNINQNADFFIPFGDASNGVSTYGGGRYLNVSLISVEETLELDFNKAYNPYCAYVADYVCPLPPKSNYISVPIEAGEKDYPH